MGFDHEAWKKLMEDVEISMKSEFRKRNPQVAAFWSDHVQHPSCRSVGFRYPEPAGDALTAQELLCHDGTHADYASFLRWCSTAATRPSLENWLWWFKWTMSGVDPAAWGTLR